MISLRQAYTELAAEMKKEQKHRKGDRRQREEYENAHVNPI